MKRIKIFLLLGGMVMLSVGVLTAYRQMQTAVSQESEVVLANIEALALNAGDGEDGFFWGNCFGYDVLCSVTCPACGAIHYTMNIGYGIISGGYCDKCLTVYPSSH